MQPTSFYKRLALCTLFLFLSACSKADGRSNDEQSETLPDDVAGNEKNEPTAKDNGSIHPLGTIIYSLLNETQFNEQIGSGWVEIKGQNISTSKLCALIASLCTLPDASGRFLRVQGGNAAATGQIQNEATAANGLSASQALTWTGTVGGGNQTSSVSGSISGGAHSHTGISIGATTVYGSDNLATGGPKYGFRTDSTATPITVSSTDSDHTHTHTLAAAAQTWTGTVSGNILGTVGLTGDAETRPMNLTVNAFIKIN